PAPATPAPAAAAAPAPEAAPPGPKPSLTPSLEYYIRGQSRFNANLDPVSGDRRHDLVQRVRLGVLGAYGPVSAFVQMQDVRQWGFEPSTTSNDGNTDLHQGYLDVAGERGDRRGYVRVGRQEINIGDGRFIANRNWNTQAQSFDALRLHGEAGRFTGDAAVFMLAPPRDFTVADPGGDPALDQTIHTRGTYAGFVNLNGKFHRAIEADLLALGASERPTPAAPTNNRDIIMAGLRLHGEPLKGFIYDVQGYGQGGKNQGLRHQAWAALAGVGYTADHRLRPGTLIRYAYATGQACTGDPSTGCNNTTSTEFYRFYGLRHAYYGLMDQVALSNLRELEAQAFMTPHETLSLNLSYHFFQLDQASGRWQNGPDQNVGRVFDPTNTDRNLGQEIDFVANWRPWKQLMIQPGYGVFLPMGAARLLQNSAPQHFAYLWIIAQF
ncbi:MAG: alginate export family protein, partial [Myxococcales bacterium]|nr:alginate export family protein [Myxococcales bacterium]